MRKSKFTTILALLSVHCSILSTAQAIQVNLTESCAHEQLFFCTLANITATLKDPLIVVNSTALNLFELVLRDSVIARIPRDLFTQAPLLKSFLMHNCGLLWLTAHDFPQGHSLKTLMLQKNRFSNVPENAFASIAELQELHLGRNMIHMVNKNAFDGLKSLAYLDLQQNNIRELPTSLFEDLISLEHIDLSNNNIEKIDVTTFQHNLKLKTLLLGDNKFSVFESNSLGHLPRLHLLDISNSNVDNLTLLSVDTLLMQGGTLQSLVIAGSAIKVHVGNNELTNLAIADKLSVRELDLHGNRFESLQDMVGMLNLQRLDVSHNQLSLLLPRFTKLYLPLPNLVHLNLAYNQLQNLVVENFLLLQKLTYLDLAYNHLQHLDQRVFEPLADLEKLYIEGNNLHRFLYEQFVATHQYLKEIGIFENKWEHRYMRVMSTFLRENSIQLPVRFTSNNYNNSPDKPSHHHYAATSSSWSDCDAADDVNGIHPYWTGRDVLVIVILLLVFLILLLQLFTLLREEECLLNCFHRITRNTHTTEPRRLEEEEGDSEV